MQTYVYFVSAIVLIAFMAYRWLIKPQKLMNYYQKVFNNKGYKTVKMDYKPFSTPFYDQWFADQEKHKDPMYHHKRQYTSVDVMVSNHLTHPSVVLMNPELIKEAYSAEKYFILEKEKDIFGIWLSIFGNGMLASERNEWKDKRKVLSRVFTYDFIIDSLPMIINIADQVFDDFENNYWFEHPEDKQKGEFKIQVSEMMKKFTSSIIISEFLGVDSLKNKSQSQSIADSIIKMSYLASNMIPDPLVMIFGEKLVNKGWRKCDRQYLEVKNNVRSVLNNHILKEKRELENDAKPESNESNEKNTKKKGKTIVKLLFEEKQKQKQPFEINSDYIMNEVITFVLAGTDSTTSFLSSMMLLIFEKPHIVQRLKQQINSVIKSDADITVQNFKKLPYVDCVINETSRMISSIINNFTKTASEDVNIGGITIKKGTLIDCSWLNVFYNPNIFENPLEFSPERWQEEDCSRHLNLVSIIFSGGPRSCIGRSLALTNIKVMMIKFMKRYENLVELHRKQRSFEFIVSYSIKNTERIITKVKNS